MLTAALRFRPGGKPVGKREPEVENTQEFSEGQPTPTRILGYKLVGDRFEVIPAEAAIVKRIYTDYLSGLGLTAICKTDERRGYKNGGQWRESVIRSILTNENMWETYCCKNLM